MAKARTLVGLDVHATKIVAAVLDAETGELELFMLGGNVAQAAGLCAGLPGAPRGISSCTSTSGGDEQQRAALQAILTGSWGGAALVQFPWAFKPSRQLGVRTVPIEVQHHARRRWFRAGEYVDVRVGDPVGGQEPVTCGSRATTSRGPSVTVNCCG